MFHSGEISGLRGFELFEWRVWRRQRRINFTGSVSYLATNFIIPIATFETNTMVPAATIELVNRCRWLNFPLYLLRTRHLVMIIITCS